MSEVIPEKKKMGRPSKFDLVKINQIRQLYLDGWDDMQVAAFYEVALSTLSTWKRDHPDFMKAIKEWKAEADEDVEKSLYERACGYRTTFKKNFVVSDGKDSGSHVETHIEEAVFPPDPTSCIFWLKNRQPEQWKDKREYEHNVSTSLAERIKAARQRVQALTVSN